MIRTHPANVFVCECITQSLFRLLKRKAYSKITVTDLVHEAGVSRNSFYRNYQNIEDIIQQFLDMKEEIALLYHAGLSHLLMKHIIQCGKQNQNGELQSTYQTAFMSGGLCGLVNEWILQGMKDSPEEMERIFLNKNSTA